MRVLHLSWEYPPLVYGGLGRHVHALAEAQAAAGHDVTVVTQQAAAAPPDEVVAGVRVVRVPHDPPLIPQDDLLAWVLALDHALARRGLASGADVRPEVVHAHDWVVCQAAVALRDGLGLPLVATVHATEAGRHQGWLPSRLSRAIHSTEWWLTDEASRVIVCSHAMRSEVVRLFDLPPARVEVVPNGIDPARWAVPRGRAAAARGRYAGAGPLVVFSGRLEWEKGVQTLLDAVPRLRRRHPGLRVVLAGQGTMGEQFRERARRLRLGRSAVFAGFLPTSEIAALTAAADCVVVPSLYEPFGMVALEAAAVGSPLVVADTGGLREVVEHGVTGLRFAPGHPAALAAAVSAVLHDRLLARRLVRHARALVDEEHDWTTLARHTVEVYARAAADSTDRPARPVVIPEGNLLADG